jgi:putative serine protease PepD
MSMQPPWLWTLVMLACYTVEPWAQANWPVVAPGLETRVVRLEMAFENGDKGVCSGAVLNKEAGYVVTCAHCVENGRSKLTALTVKGLHAEPVRQNTLLDIAVVRTDFSDDPHVETIPLAADVPTLGSDVAVMGYAFGKKRMYAQFGRVSLPIDDDGLLVIDGMAISGESGGPTINAAGELVGLTSSVIYHGPMHLALMVPVKQVREFVKQYLPKATK